MRAWICLVVAAVLITIMTVNAAASWSATPGSELAATLSQGSAATDPGTAPGSADPATDPAVTSPVSDSATTPIPLPPWRPGSVFDGKLLVAYYGTAGTGSLGVLGDGSIPDVTARLRAAAAPFAAASGKKVQIVYELIATVADRYPGPDGSYSHDLPRSEVEAYLAAARRNHALLVLDLQPGRDTFPAVAKRYAWALKEPDVGVALDPEWRMGPTEIPGHVFGSVSAAEVNETADYVAGIARANRLPQKVFIIHQFTPSMVSHISRIHPVKGLAMVQHIDGWGGRSDKLATYHSVARPQQFVIGFKLFYRQDQDMFSPRELLHAVPRTQFISYQ